MSRDENQEICLWSSPLIATDAAISHGVTERGGGTSAAPFDTLNLGLHVGDLPEAVVANRERGAALAGMGLERMVCAQQVHGAQVAVVTGADAGRGAVAFDAAVPEVDALVTDTEELLLALYFADCLPILLADPVRRVVAVAHAGWRGLVDGVIENTIAAMADGFGVRTAEVTAAVGPGIGRCCFAVGQEVAERFPAAQVIIGKSGQPHVDLPGVARQRLQAAGVPAERIVVAEECTACHTDRYFSHRREGGRTGRMAAFIALRERCIAAPPQH